MINASTTELPSHADPLWPAPSVSDRIDAVVTVPGSKSLTNRYLILAAVADGTSRLRAPLRSRDTLLMAEAIRTLGVDVTDDGADWVITPPTVLRGHARVECGLAGTVMRFLPAVAALAQGPVEIDGDVQARQRPMGPILAGLRALGVGVDDGGRGTLPFVIEGRGFVPGGEVEVDASGSSQFISGLLLAGARFQDGLTVRHIGATLPSLPHIDMTVAVLRAAGVEVDDSQPHRWSIAPGPVRAMDVAVEPDLSNAGPFLAAALVAGGKVSVPGWPAATTQAGDQLRWILERLGASVELTPTALTVKGSGHIEGIDADLHDVGELTPAVAALAALADGPSRLSGIRHLRGHETDRLAALANEINRLGGDCEEFDDGLIIRPRTLHGGTWLSYADHRMATAGAIIGLAVPGVEVENITTTRKTLPDFPGMWKDMLNTTATNGSLHA